MMSIFIARHLISIIAQIAKKAMKVPQKNCIKSPAKEGGDSGWSKKNLRLVHWQLFGWGHIIFGSKTKIPMKVKNIFFFARRLK